MRVIYCQDYLRFPKINSNELHRMGVWRWKDMIYIQGKKKKNVAKSGLPSKYPQFMYIMYIKS